MGLSKLGCFLTGIESTILITTIILSVSLNTIGNPLLFFITILGSSIGLIFNLIFLTDEKRNKQ